MAMRYSITAPIFIQKPASTKKPITKMLLRSNNHVADATNSISIQIKPPSVIIKVFEDGSKGIVCYRDDNGEITCEGYDDEGPRFHNNQISRFTCNSRDSEIVEHLQRCLEIVDGGESNHGDKGV